MLDRLQRDTFGYFVHEVNPANGLVSDSTRYGAPASIAAVGLGLAAYAVAVEGGFMTREEGVTRTLATLRFFWESPQGSGPEATGVRGFYYHFLNMKTGRRSGASEVSTLDTAILLAGALTVASFFDMASAPREAEIRQLADGLFRRADWQWAADAGPAVCHGWKPESGFLPYHWRGYNEALLLYALALGSPTHPLPPQSYAEWVSTYRWKKLYGFEFLYGGPLFVHQLSHIWIDFRGIQDAAMAEKGIDYFENSRRATLVQQRYAVRNPRRFTGYDEYAWGITASDGPGPARRRIGGRDRRFHGYCARGVPYGPDDGTLSPWSVVASLPFAPEIVLPTIESLLERHPETRSQYGFLCSYNPTFASSAGANSAWVAKGYYGLDQGPVVLMIENYLAGSVWRWMRRCPYLVRGLRRAGFTGGWLEGTV